MTDPSPTTAAWRKRLDMPFLLLCGMGFGAFFATVALLVLAGMLVMLPFSSGITVNAVPVTRTEFMQKSWPLLVGFSVAAGCVLAIVYALWRELAWSRRAIIAYWVVSLVAVCVMAVISGNAADLVPNVVMFGSVIGLLWWYLYRKPTVRAYYSALEALPRNRATRSLDIARREA
jgi:predicted lysophospholipase L1 biosynthesis ABC-type transport system permease subunit